VSRKYPETQTTSACAKDLLAFPAAETMQVALLEMQAGAVHFSPD
jgi:hypothetical protein